MIGNEAAKLLWRRARGGRADCSLYRRPLRAAVERQFEIIGEAFAGLRRIAPALAARIPDLPRIIAFRNVQMPRGTYNLIASFKQQIPSFYVVKIHLFYLFIIYDLVKSGRFSNVHI
jgi:hypothetical protein